MTSRPESTGATHHAADPSRKFANHAEFYRESAYSKFEQEHRAGGSMDMTMIDVVQEPIDMIDSPVPDYVFCSGRTEHPAELWRLELDYGDGSMRYDSAHPGLLSLVPSNVSGHFRVDHNHRVRMVILPASTVDTLLAEHGLAGSVFARFFTQAAVAANEPGVDPILRTIDAIWQAARPVETHENRVANSGGGGGTNALLIDALSMQLIALAATDGGECHMVARWLDAAPAIPMPSDPRLARVIDYIEAYIGTDLSLAGLASVAALSPSQLTRAFRAATGETVWAFVQRRRAERAVELAIGTRLALSEIAFRMGFSSHSHMTRVVKQRYGMTPGEIRSA